MATLRIETANDELFESPAQAVYVGETPAFVLPTNALEVKYPAHLLPGRIDFYDYEGKQVDIIDYRERWFLAYVQVDGACTEAVYVSKYNECVLGRRI